MKKHLVTVVVSTLLASGCSIEGPYRDDPHFAPVVPNAPIAPDPIQGGLYHQPTSLSLFDSIKARQVGDIITVMLTEQTQSTVEMDTDLSRETSASIANPTILGSLPQFDAPGILPLESNKNNTLEVALDSASDFKGEGDSNQKNSLSGTITVTVSQILPNGNLVIRGEKWLNLNQSEEYIRLSGIIRQEDITSTNTVLSTQIANARISYGGRGALAESNRPGWLARAFTNIIWPF